MRGGRPVAPEPVCAEPKVFIGQIPPGTTKEAIESLFSQYGTVESVIMISGAPDGLKPNSAMVIFQNFTAVEAACEGENDRQNLGTGKPLVVRVANPGRAGQLAITPKKLFIGQVQCL